MTRFGVPPAEQDVTVNVPLRGAQESGNFINWDIGRKWEIFFLLNLLLLVKPSCVWFRFTQIQCLNIIFLNEKVRVSNQHEIEKPDVRLESETAEFSAIFPFVFCLF